MPHKKVQVYILTALLVVVAVFFGVLESGNQPPLSFRAGLETIHLWENEPGEAYVVLPGYVNLDQLIIQTNETQMFDDQALTDGMDCGSLALEHPYTLQDGSTLTFLRSENLPTLYLDTASGNMDYVHEEKGNAEPGRLRIYDAAGDLTVSGSVESVKARGNSTFALEKKPYSLTLSQTTDLLGMGAAKNWILLANALDDSHLKNKFVYDFASEAGLPYSPESRWVELYLNGEYSGLYLLCERNELAPGRVEVKQGFLVSKEQLFNLAEGDAPYFKTEAGVYLRLRANNLSQTRMEQILRQAENAILAPGGMDPETGSHWSQLLDLDSWARKYLVEEIFGGIDAGIASQYLFYDQAQERIFAGPVWDYDDTMGNAIWLGGELMLYPTPEMFFAHRPKETPWFHSLYQDDVFYEYLTEVYRDVFSPLLATYIQERIPEYMDYMGPAALLDHLRWGGTDPRQAAEDMVWYLESRKEFLDSAWIENRLFIPVQIDFSYEEFMTKYAVFDYAVTPGDFLPKLPTPEGYSWYITDTPIPFDQGRPILQETKVELRKNDDFFG